MSNKDFQNGLIVGLAKGGSSSQEYVDSFGLKTLTLGNLEKAYIQNLETGIYCVTVEEGGRAGIYAGTSAHHVMDTAYLTVGGSNYTEETADKDGVTRYNKSYILINGITNQAFYYAGLIDSEKLDGVWTHTKVGGDVIETKDNKAFVIDEEIRDHTQYISALAVKEYVDGAIEGIEIPDVSKFITEIPSEYITETELNAKGYLTEHQSLEGYVTEEYVNSVVGDIEIPEVDLSGYAKKTDIPDVSNFITEIPSEYVTETELNDKGYLTEHQSLTDYAKKENIPDVSKFITEIPEEYVTDSELNEKGYLTEHQSLDGKADKEHTHTEYLTEHQSLEGLATEDYVDTKAKEYSDSIVGNLSDYWNSGLQVQDVMSAINANANWVNYNFEKASDRVQNLFDYSTDETKHPSAKATYDLMKFVYDLVMPVKIYDDPKGFEASNDDAGDTWHLTGLDLSPYKRIKCYVSSGGDGDSNYSPQHIVEIHLDDRAKGSFGYFTADHAGHCPDNRNRHHMVTFTVNAEKTAIQFQHSISMYGTSASDSVGGRRCYLIEGYYI